MVYVAYYRVSTQDQGKDGYGIQDQESVVKRYVGNNELIASFKETESGSKSDRPELLKALALCKKEKATLVIARLDRLARNLYFVAKLQNSKIDFVCCDIPDANKFTIQLLAAVAEQYLDTLRKNTKAALAIAKKNGVQLGNPKNLKQASIKGNKVKQQQADQFANKINEIIKSIRAAGLNTFQDISVALNNRGIKTYNDGAWYPTTVKNIIERVGV